MSEATTLSCQKCGEADFKSRNALFKHLRKDHGDEEKKKNTLAAFGDNLPEEPHDLSNLYLYVTGGRVRGRTLGSVERYSLGRQCWEPCPYMVENRGSHGAVGLGTKLFLMGGGGFRSNLATCEVFDTVKQEWKHIAPMKTYRHALAVISASIDPTSDPVLNKDTPVTGSAPKKAKTTSPSTTTTLKQVVYAIGGWVNGSICSPDVERYDVDTDSWHVCAPLSAPRRLLGATTVDGRLFTFGGNCDNHKELRPLNPQPGEEGGEKKQAGAGAGAGAEEGEEPKPAQQQPPPESTPTTSTQQQQKKTPKKPKQAEQKQPRAVWYSAAAERYDPPTDTWTRVRDLPHPGPTSAVTVGPFAYVFLHGKSGYRYCPTQDTYTPLAPLPLPQWFCFEATAVGSTIYVNGGMSKGVWKDCLYAYRVLADEWEELPSMSKQRRRCAAAVVSCPPGLGMGLGKGKGAKAGEGEEEEEEGGAGK